MTESLPVKNDELPIAVEIGRLVLTRLQANLTLFQLFKIEDPGEGAITMGTISGKGAETERR